MFIYKAFYALFRCTSVPSRGGAFWWILQNWRQLQQLNRRIMLILYNVFKNVLRLFYFVDLISLHWHNKTAVQGKSQSHSIKINTNHSWPSLYIVLYSVKVFRRFFKANLNEIRSKNWNFVWPIFGFQNHIWRGFQNFCIIFLWEIFSIFRVQFERNLDQILGIVKIEIANIKCHT